MLDLQGTCPEKPCLRGSPAYPPGDRALARLAEEVPAPGAKNRRLNAKCFFAIFGRFSARRGAGVGCDNAAKKALPKGKSPHFLIGRKGLMA